MKTELNLFLIKVVLQFLVSLQHLSEQKLHVHFLKGLIFHKIVALAINVKTKFTIL